jgi:hypothetical protein
MLIVASIYLRFYIEVGVGTFLPTPTPPKIPSDSDSTALDPPTEIVNFKCFTTKAYISSLPGRHAVPTGKQSSMFRKTILPLYSGSSCLSCWVGTPDSWDWGIWSSETLVTTSRHGVTSQKTCKLQHHRCKNLKSQNNSLVGIEVTRLQDGCGLSPCRGKTVFFSKTAKRLWRLQSLLVNGYQG